MIRILIFLLLTVFLAFAVTGLTGVDSQMEIVAFGRKMTPPTGLAVGAFAAFVLILVWLTSVTKDILSLPKHFRTKRREAKQERGMAALARGMESVLVGDAVDAQHHARIARRNLEQTSLTRLLTAQAAQLSGDDQSATQNFTLMLEAPETEFLGLHGLYGQALRAENKEAARQYAERAFKLRPNARWAFESVLELNLERGAWGEAREVLRVAKNNRLLTDDVARRGEAALLTAGAYNAGAAGDAETALKEAEAAFKLCPDLTPAAVLTATGLADADKKPKALKTLEQSFALSAHPAITGVYERIQGEDDKKALADALKRLEELSPESHEGRFIAVRREMLFENWDKASMLLEPLVVDYPYSREMAAMAEIMGEARGPEVARGWLERAARAPRDPMPGADGSFNFTREGWAKLVTEYLYHARLAPAPVEDRPPPLSMEEVKLLAAPPVADAGDPATADEADAASADDVPGPEYNEAAVSAEAAAPADAEVSQSSQASETETAPADGQAEPEAATPSQKEAEGPGASDPGGGTDGAAQKPV